MIIVGVITFTLGWFSNSMNLFAEGVIADGKRNDSLKKLMKLPEEVSQEELDNNQIENNKTTNFAEKLEGQFIMKDANCAGFNFINKTHVTWTNEIDCYIQDTLKIKWLNNSTFFTQDRKQNNSECPPRVWIYQVISFDEKTLILKDFWTGWNNKEDSRIELTKNKN